MKKIVIFVACWDVSSKIGAVIISLASVRTRWGQVSSKNNSNQPGSVEKQQQQQQQQQRQPQHQQQQQQHQQHQHQHHHRHRQQ